MSALASGSLGEGGAGHAPCSMSHVPHAPVDPVGQTMQALRGGQGDRLLSATCAQHFLLYYKTHSAAS